MLSKFFNNSEKKLFPKPSVLGDMGKAFASKEFMEKNYVNIGK